MLIQAVALVALRAVSMKRVGARAGPALSGGRPFRNNWEADQTQALSQAGAAGEQVTPMPLLNCDASNRFRSDHLFFWAFKTSTSWRWGGTFLFCPFLPGSLELPLVLIVNPSYLNIPSYPILPCHDLWSHYCLSSIYACFIFPEKMLKDSIFEDVKNKLFCHRCLSLPWAVNAIQDFLSLLNQLVQLNWVKLHLQVFHLGNWDQINTPQCCRLEIYLRVALLFPCQDKTTMSPIPSPSWRTTRGSSRRPTCKVNMDVEIEKYTALKKHICCSKKVFGETSPLAITSSSLQSMVRTFV